LLQLFYKINYLRPRPPKSKKLTYRDLQNDVISLEKF
jgi:hypothetical protein